MAGLEKQISNIIEAVTKGFASASMAAKLAELEARAIALRESRQYKGVTEDDLRSLFEVFRQYIKERNVPEIKKIHRQLRGKGCRLQRPL